jgi:hypothetical protein
VIEGYPLTFGARFFCISPSLTFLEAIAVVAGLDDFASMRESIEQGGWSSWRRRTRRSIRRRTSWYKLFGIGFVISSVGQTVSLPRRTVIANDSSFEADWHRYPLTTVHTDAKRWIQSCVICSGRPAIRLSRTAEASKDFWCFVRVGRLMYAVRRGK